MPNPSPIQDEPADELNPTLSQPPQLLRMLDRRWWALAVPGAFADELTRTPRQTEGPFYPNKLPLDTDNDLIIVNDSLTAAVGEITHLSGRLLDHKGDPIRNCLIEIWQVDNNGAYIHTRDPAHAKHDANFQGFGRFLTGSTRTATVSYCKDQARAGPGGHPISMSRSARTARMAADHPVLHQGVPSNEKDGIYRGIRDTKARESVTAEFAPLPGSKIGELAARVDVVLGFTPEA